MMKFFLIAAALLAAVTATTASAAEKTIKLSVPGMTCASCPYMVEQAVSEVGGVNSVVATMDGRTATVTFENTLTSIEAIQQATASIGYPSTIIDDKGS